MLAKPYFQTMKLRCQKNTVVSSIAPGCRNLTFLTHCPLLDSSVSENVCSIQQYKYLAVCASSAASLQEVMRLIRTSYADLQTKIIVVYQTLRSSPSTSNLPKLQVRVLNCNHYANFTSFLFILLGLRKTCQLLLPHFLNSTHISVHGILLCVLIACYVTYTLQTRLS
jgi:hypothetical protein